MIQTAQATFQIKNFTEVPLAEAEKGPVLSRGTFVLTYQGDLQGEAILEELQVRFSEKRASMTGLMRFTGRVGEFQGSVVLKHEGKTVNGRVTSVQTVVPGSATEGLKGLRGEMKHESGPAKEFSAIFRYRFA